VHTPRIERACESSCELPDDAMVPRECGAGFDFARVCACGSSVDTPPRRWLRCPVPAYRARRKP